MLSGDTLQRLRDCHAEREIAVRGHFGECRNSNRHRRTRESVGDFVFERGHSDIDLFRISCLALVPDAERDGLRVGDGPQVGRRVAESVRGANELGVLRVDRPPRHVAVVPGVPGPDRLRELRVCGACVGVGEWDSSIIALVIAESEWLPLDIGGPPDALVVADRDWLQLSVCRPDTRVSDIEGDRDLASSHLNITIRVVISWVEIEYVGAVIPI